jgi:hypothetical protein
MDGHRPNDNHRKNRAPGITPLERRMMLDASLPVVAGQVLWLDAADAATIRDTDGDYASSGIGGANNGFSGTVATWVDKSASGFNVANATPAQQPTYTVGGLNGKNILTFDGAADKLTNAGAVIAGNDYTTFVVFNRTTAAARDGVFELGGGGSRNALFVNESANKLGYYINGSFFHSSNVYTASTYEVVSIVHDTTTFGLWRNGSSEISTTGGTTRATTTGIYVGDDSSTGDQLQGNIAEIIVYDRDLTPDERRDIQNYLGNKWGITINGNATPVLATNAGGSLLQGANLTIASAILASTDADNSESILRYTITDLADYGSLTNTNTAHTYVLGESFTQADIDAGYIRYAHNNTANFTDSFSFTVSDGYATTAGSTFNISITPSNQAPAFGGYTLVSSEDFQAGATGWSINTTETFNPYLTRFLGRHSNEAGAQNVFKTYTLSGTQDSAVISFDFYRLDSWDTEQFRIFIDDVMIYNQTFLQNYVSGTADGSSGNVSWTVQEITPFAANFVGGTWNDQLFRFTLRVDTGASSVKLGFSSTTNQGITDEAWGVDNIDIYEVGAGGTPGPYEVSEVTSNGSIIGYLSATDPDAGDTLSYSITGGTGAGIFAVDANTGAISVANAAAINYESVISYTLAVRVTDNGTPAAYDDATITIDVLNVPENTAPVLAALGPLTVAENAAVNTVVGTASATDAESNTITYSISAGNTDNIFAINGATGAIRVSSTANLNYEWDNSYTLTIVATDNGFGNLTHSRNVTINVTNVNEAPTFNIPQSFLNQNPYLRYDATTGNFYRYVGTTATYAAATTAAAGMLLNGVAGHIATIGSAAENTYVRGLGSGALWLGANDTAVEGEWRWEGSGPEAGALFSLGSVAQGGYYTNWTAGQPDNGSNSDYLEMATSGQWTDVNGGNRAYVIEWEGADVMAALGNGPFTLAENPANGASVGFVHARDADAADTTIYSITGGTGQAHFAVNATTGEITVTGPAAINYESATSFTLDLRVQDAGGLFNTQTVTINVTDVNETPVMPAAGPFSVAETAAANTVVGSVSATDVDASQTITYSITGGNTGNVFAINGATGAIRIANTTYFDYELLNSYNLTIRATDNGTGSLFAQRTVTINVTDVNEEPSFDAVQRVLNADPTLHYSAATGNFYRYVTATANLATAQANAAAATVNGVAGYVTNINNAAENTFVASILQANSWIGGADITVEGEWRWMAGPEAGTMFWLGAAGGSVQNGLYANWSGGEPNNSGGNEDGIELRTNGQWNDTNVTGARPYVIEWDGAAVMAGMANGAYAINENTSAGTVVGNAVANDPDGGDTLTYSITGGTGAGIFNINAATGQLTLAGALNFEAVSSYTLNLRVQDVAGLFSTVTVTVNVNDINDIPSAMALAGDTIEENSPLDTLIGSLSTTDEDPADTHTYSLVTNPGEKFVIVGNELRTAGGIDYEQAQSYTITLRADDGNGGTVDRTFVIQVGDQMDTFTPPPSSGSGGTPEPFVPREDEEPARTVNVLGASLEGEAAQGRAFYGAGGWQVLRENVTFQIREIIARFMGPAADLAAMDTAEAAPDAPPEQAVDMQARYTNLRQALAFLQQVEESGGRAGAVEGTDGEAGHNLPPDTVERQFVDVMTYHQERAAKLRAALRGQG